MLRVTILISTGFAEVKVIANLAFVSYATYWVFATSVTCDTLYHDYVPQEFPADVRARATPAFKGIAVVRLGSMGRQRHQFGPQHGCSRAAMQIETLEGMQQ